MNPENPNKPQVVNSNLDNDNALDQETIRVVLTKALDLDMVENVETGNDKPVVTNMKDAKTSNDETVIINYNAVVDNNQVDIYTKNVETVNDKPVVTKMEDVEKNKC